MKNYLFVFSFLFVVHAVSQELNYCDYFTLGVSEGEYEGMKSKSYWPVVLNKNDEFGKFVRKHGERFDYILFREHAAFDEVGTFYPDSSKIQNAYCQKVVGTEKIRNYFSALSPETLVTWQKADTFSVEELLLTASKFFYCDGLDAKDTTIQWHICVGINGQNEYKSNRDLTLLEAFSIEAIMHYLSHAKDPEFLIHFDHYSSQMTKTRKTGFKDFDSYLLEIRNLCYMEMQNNGDLKKKLLKYYRKNSSNLNFVIR